MQNIHGANAEKEISAGPPELPPPNDSRVVFIDSTVVKADVERWPAGFAAPVLTQNWNSLGGENEPDDMHYPDWDTLHITAYEEHDVPDVTGPNTRFVEIGLHKSEPDEGYPSDHGVHNFHMIPRRSSLERREHSNRTSRLRQQMR